LKVFKVSYLCTAGAGGFPSTFKLNLTATATTTGGCIASSNAANTVVSDQVPTVEVKPNDVEPFCALDGTVTATFNVTVGSSNVDYVDLTWTLTPEVVGLPEDAKIPACAVSAGPAELDELATDDSSKSSHLLNRAPLLHALDVCWKPGDASCCAVLTRQNLALLVGDTVTRLPAGSCEPFSPACSPLLRPAPLLSPTETYKVTVECTNTTHGLPSPFNLQLTAKVETLGHCVKADAKTKEISGYGVPRLTVTTLPVASYCGGSTTSLGVKFTVYSPDVPPVSGWSYSTEVTDVDDSVAPICNAEDCSAFTGDADGECLARRQVGRRHGPAIVLLDKSSNMQCFVLKRGGSRSCPSRGMHAKLHDAVVPKQHQPMTRIWQVSNTPVSIQGSIQAGPWTNPQDADVCVCSCPPHAALSAQGTTR
jgi:hypothetical protein